MDIRLRKNRTFGLTCKMCGKSSEITYTIEQTKALIDGYSIMLECPKCKEKGHHLNSELLIFIKDS